jgi:hypothetical protein
MDQEIRYLLTMRVLPTYPHCTLSKMLYDLSHSFFFFTHAYKYNALCCFHNCCEGYDGEIFMNLRVGGKDE